MSEILLTVHHIVKHSAKEELPTHVPSTILQKTDISSKGKVLPRSNNNSDHARRISCNLCPLKFKTKKCLQAHESTKHKELFEYHCDRCKKLFRHHDLFIRHNENKH